MPASNSEKSTAEAHAAAQDVVLRFAEVWTQWEFSMAKDKDSLRDPAMKEAHGQMIADFCTEKKRGYVDGLLSYSNPPVYQDVVAANVFNVESATKTRVHVDVKCTFRDYRFVVLKKPEGWRIDGIKWWNGYEKAWKSGLIGS